MTESFGARLRHERERRQIELQSIADGTKINVALLEGLERDDVARWPSGIFRKCFVRSYAQAIGMDPDAVWREFGDLYPDPIEPVPVSVLTAVVAPPVEPAASMKTRLVSHAKRLARLLESRPLVTLRIVSSGSSFSRGMFLADFRRRWAAAACDTGVSFVIAVACFGVLGNFWTPLGISMLCYYVGGILILGNTPGVCLFAPASDGLIGAGRGRGTHTRP